MEVNRAVGVGGVKVSKKNKINIKKKEQSGTIDSANEANNGKKQLFEKVDTTREGYGINNGEIN